MMDYKQYLFLGLMFVAAHLWSGPGEFALEPGVLIEDEPYQTGFTDRVKWKHDDFVITPLAHFEMDGRVVLSARYRFGTTAKLSPVDLVLAWGPLSDTRILKEISFSQRGRFYYWRTDNTPPVPLAVIKHHTANMHMVPANTTVRRKLLELERDDLISLKGYLIRIDRPDGWHWVSSLTRKDTGAGACEVVWVEEVHKFFRKTVS